MRIKNQKFWDKEIPKGRNQNNNQNLFQFLLDLDLFKVSSF